MLEIHGRTVELGIAWPSKHLGPGLTKNGMFLSYLGTRDSGLKSVIVVNGLPSKVIRLRFDFGARGEYWLLRKCFEGPWCIIRRNFSTQMTPDNNSHQISLLLMDWSKGDECALEQL